MPNDHRGITLVELIIAIAISTVILGAATLFLGMAHKNYNHASAQIDLQSESQILMEQIGMWVMEGNRVEELDPSVSGVRGIAIYTIPNTPSVTNPAGAAAPEAASKRVIWISAGGKKLYTKKMAVADPKTDTTVISADTDEVQENLIGEYVTAFTGTVNASAEKASVSVSFDMQYLEQKYTIQNEFKQIGMWVMEGNRVEELDPSVSGVRGIAIYTIPNTPSVTNPAGAAAPEAASKRVIWISAGGKKLYTKKMAVADPKTDTTVISADTDEVQENLIGEYVTAFTGTVNASAEKASVSVSFDMQYLEQKYTIQNEFKLRNVLR